MTKKLVKPRELECADVVETSPDGPWNYAIVKKVTETQIFLFRPYGTTSDFKYTGGVICYIGIDEYAIERSDERPLMLLERKPLR